MTDESSDPTGCLDRVRRHDPEAARELVGRLHPLVLRIVRSHLPARAAEEDLAQEVFLRVFTRLDRYREQDGVPFEHWVSRVAVRTCLDALRAERRRPEVRWTDLPEGQEALLGFLVEDDAELPDSSAAASRELMERLLGGLSAADRLVVSLLDLEGRTVREIAALTGWSVTGVKVRAFRARRKLRGLAEKLRKERPYERF